MGNLFCKEDEDEEEKMKKSSYEKKMKEMCNQRKIYFKKIEQDFSFKDKNFELIIQNNTNYHMIVFIICYKKVQLRSLVGLIEDYSDNKGIELICERLYSKSINFVDNFNNRKYDVNYTWKTKDYD